MLIPHAPLGLITTSVQALAGVLLPSATVFLLLLCNDKEVLGPFVNRPWLNWLAGLIVSVLIGLSLILMTTTVFAGVDVKTLTVVVGSLVFGGFIGTAAVSVVLGRRRRAAARRLAADGEPEPAEPQLSRSRARVVADAAARAAAAAEVVAGAVGGDVPHERLPRRRGGAARREGGAAGDRTLNGMWPWIYRDPS